MQKGLKVKDPMILQGEGPCARVVQAGSLMAHIFGVKQGWFGGEDRTFIWPRLTATKCYQGFLGTGMLFAPNENQTLPKEQTVSGNARRRETKAQRGSVANGDILGLIQGLSIGPFYNLERLLLTQPVLRLIWAMYKLLGVNFSPQRQAKEGPFAQCLR